MPSQWAAERRRTYDALGYIGPITLMAPEAMRTYRTHVEAFESKYADATKKLYQGPHVLAPWLQDIIRNPNLLDAAEDLFGPNILMMNSGFRIKEPGTKTHSPWHQDALYMKYEPAWATVMVAFSDYTEENGCLRFIAGSHTGELLPHEESRENDPIQTRGQRITCDFDRTREIAMPLKAGQATIFHPMIIHGSPPNRSAGRRIGMIFEYCPTETRRIGSRDSAMLVRGIDTYGNFDVDPVPRVEYGPEEVKNYFRKIDSRTRESYKGSTIVPRPLT